MSLCLYSFNVKGIRDLLKRKAIFLFLKRFKADFYLLQETHATTSDFVFWKNQWGSDIWLAHGSNKSAGVADLKGNYKGKILKSKAHSHGRWLILVVEDDSNVLILGNIYGDNYTLQNMMLLQNFREEILDFFKIYPNAQLILGGDWNTINDPFLNCFPPRISRQSQYTDIFNLCSQSNCRDEWRHRNLDKIDFTWSNKDRSIQSRIDFWLTSVELGNQIQQTDIVPSVFSDHKMIHLVISLGDTRTRGSNFNYWKLNNSLLEDVQFKDKVKSVIKRCYNNAKISGLY